MPQITKLSELTTTELTLTKRGANDRVFAVTKGNIPMNPEIISALVSTPAEGEDLFIETLKSQGKAEGEEFDAAIAAYRVQKGMKDLVDSETMSQVSKSAGYEVAKAENPFAKNPKKKPAKGAAEEEDEMSKDDVKKSVDLSELDEATRASVEAVFKSNSDLVAKSEAQADVLKSLTTTVANLQDQREEQLYVAKAAKEFGNIPMADKDLGLLLKSAHAAGPEFAKQLEGLLGTLDETVSKSALLTTMGAAQQNAGQVDAWGRIEGLAKGMVQKSSESLSHAAAVSLVLKTEEGARLYAEYEAAR